MWWLSLADHNALPLLVEMIEKAVEDLCHLSMAKERGRGRQGEIEREREDKFSD